jgi:DnaJ-class molecular chaperone
MRVLRRFLLIALPALFILPFLSNGLQSKGKMNEETYYDILGVDPKTCKLTDIKKAYRKLALLYHPDRVPLEKKEESTIKFQEVSGAYEVLSNEHQRAEYDRSLKYGSTGAGGNSNAGHHHNMHQQQHHRNHRDPFSQFNDLFRNDPFFSEAFNDMDDLFSQTFQNKNNVSNDKNKKKGWVESILGSLGIDFSFNSSIRNADGTFSTSTYERSSNSNGRSSRSYTSKSTRTVIENGRRITIQSMEKDGNRIEERYEGDKLVQRLVNDRPQNIGKLADGNQRDL